jgi:hypothetical protein
MADISAYEDRKSVLLRTLDVRQIRRGILGKRKASGMKSNKSDSSKMEHELQVLP